MAVIMSRFMTVRERVNYVPWIESSGTQYIDTLFKPKYNTRVVLDISDVTSVDTLIFGAKDADSATAATQFAIYRRNATTVRSDYFGTNALANISDTATRTTIDKNGATVTMWGQTVQNAAVSTGEVPYTMYLFSANAGGKASTYCKAKIYSCQIYDNDVLVRDLWPCYDPDGIACLYDKVSKTYFYNKGTGSFGTGESGAVSEITFTINGTAFTAEQGVTWRTFVNSSYNPGNFSIDTSGVRYGSSLVRDSGGNAVLADAVIISGHAYKTL